MSGARTIEDGARLSIVEQSVVVVMTLVEGLARDDLLRSRLTRTEVHRQLVRLAGGAAGVSARIRGAMPEIDWEGWQLMQVQLALPPGLELDDALWFACESLAPATLLWLRLHRQRQGTLFQMTI
ncbi:MULTISPECIES: hypothetical protein [Paraburkholderia]|uniref:Uncharacterized protein n=1 Tax=Paraburkholderia tropica TaxID=92647 RepID=A0AAQ1JYG1_9BURK|nr:hypothetical protein [Paraburkholderia tropica]RQN36330.1 hypothetical protein EHZ25_25320 [Paraburkholderia tropica]SEK15030.1 hypothetical protein SAMN05216550_13347 [Paraburkholderia tropica]